MTDQTIPADEVRTIIAFYRDDASNRGDEILESLRYLLPPLPRPTLADMTLDEQAECVGMQADLAQGDRVVILDGTPDSDGLVQVMEASLDVYRPSPKEVTPRPDLPRLEWPSDKKPDPGPALPDGWRVADHKDNGRVIVTNTTPNRDGYVCYVLPADDYALGYDWLLCKPYELTYLDTDQ